MVICVELHVGNRDDSNIVACSVAGGVLNFQKKGSSLSAFFFHIQTWASIRAMIGRDVLDAYMAC